MAALVDERKPDFTTHRTQDDWANFRYRGGGSLIIQVVTTVQLLPDCLGDFLLVLNEVVPMVKAEEGCLVYEPMVDCEIGLPSQGKLRQNTVTLVEAWLKPG